MVADVGPRHQNDAEAGADGCVSTQGLGCSTLWGAPFRAPEVTEEFSWTQRGLPCIIAMALFQAWKWEIDLTGAVCPLPEGLGALVRVD